MSQSLEDKLKAIRVWMTDTDEAVSSQDSLQSTQALLPDEIDMIYSSFMEVSWEVMTAVSYSFHNSLKLTPSYLGAWCYAFETKSGNDDQVVQIASQGMPRLTAFGL